MLPAHIEPEGRPNRIFFLCVELSKTRVQSTARKQDHFAKLSFQASPVCLRLVHTTTALKLEGKRLQEMCRTGFLHGVVYACNVPSGMVEADAIVAFKKCRRHIDMDHRHTEEINLT